MIKPNYTYKAKVVKIIDGDTIDVDIDLGFQITQRHRLRINRINTFELRGTKDEVKQLAIAGKEFTSEKVFNKEIVIITEKSDAFGRYLAEVFYMEDGVQKNLSDELLDNKLAVLYTKK